MLYRIQLTILSLIGLIFIGFALFAVYFYFQGWSLNLIQAGLAVASLLIGLFFLQSARKVHFKILWIKERIKKEVREPSNWRVKMGVDQRLQHKKYLDYSDRRSRNLIHQREERRVKVRRQRESYVPHMALAIFGFFMIVIGSGVVSKNITTQNSITQGFENWVQSKTMLTSHSLQKHFDRLKGSEAQDFRAPASE